MDDDLFRFFFEPDAPPSSLEGWGRGCLYLGGMPYWFGDIDNNAGLIHWTWLDLLEFFGENWLALCLEQQYPFSWLARGVAHPGQMWEVAERRWALLGDDEEKLFIEEETVIAFIARHNLAQAWKGLSLPQLLWLRAGENLWLVPEHDKPLLIPFRNALAQLEDIGHRIAASMIGSPNPRARRALASWDRRERIDNISDYVALATGWQARDQALIEAELDASLAQYESSAPALLHRR